MSLISRFLTPSILSGSATASLLLTWLRRASWVALCFLRAWICSVLVRRSMTVLMLYLDLSSCRSDGVASSGRADLNSRLVLTTLPIYQLAACSLLLGYKLPASELVHRLANISEVQEVFELSTFVPITITITCHSAALQSGPWDKRLPKPSLFMPFQEVELTQCCVSLVAPETVIVVAKTPSSNAWRYLICTFGKQGSI